VQVADSPSYSVELAGHEVAFSREDFETFGWVAVIPEERLGGP
jgi:hypothetical protein